MKRKFWAVALSLVAVLCLAFALTACGGNKTECEKNGHSFTTEWTSDTTDHWHKCANCDEISDKAAHVYKINLKHRRRLASACLHARLHDNRGGISADGCICVRSRRDKRCTWQRVRDPCTAQADMAS